MRQQTMQTRWGLEHCVLMDAAEIPLTIDKNFAAMGRWSGHRASDWTGDNTYDMRRMAELGDERRVAESDKFLNQIEDQVPMSRGWRNIDDVVGAVPNVPAFLAGHPQCMRRRERVAKDNAPLSIYMDLTSSALIHERDVARRGVVLLALVRMLVEHRPVTLWVGVTQDVGRNAGTVAWRIDTTPLDLARAAYHISATAMSRRFGYSINNLLNRSGGGWGYGNMHTQATSGPERFRQLFEQEVLFVPPLLGTDQMVSDPVGWIKRTMSQYVKGDDT